MIERSDMHIAGAPTGSVEIPSVPFHPLQKRELRIQSDCRCIRNPVLHLLAPIGDDTGLGQFDEKIGSPRSGKPTWCRYNLIYSEKF